MSGVVSLPAIAKQRIFEHDTPWPYFASVFLSAFLLFQVQLIVGKYFLPWFGGTPAMWTTCMFFFQTLLVAGYVYAHVLATRFDVKRQGGLHVGVLVFSFSFALWLAFRWHSPLLPNSDWKPGGPENPVRNLVMLLGLSSGVPYFALSATGPLLQSWFARSHPAASPYRLYSLSNLGSFLALLSYPFALEPWFTLRIQAEMWFAVFAAFVLVCSCCSLELKQTSVPVDVAGSEVAGGEPSPSLVICMLWLMLAACGSLLFLSTTNQICQNIAVVPLLWILPLSIYLLSLVICFDRPKYYFRSFWCMTFTISLVLAFFLLSGGAITHLPAQILGYTFVLFAGCMVCHGELARSKPGVRYLTTFYLMVSIGGALGGVFVVLVAPQIFRSFSEYQLGLWTAALLMLVAVIRDRNSWIYTQRFGVLVLALSTAVVPGAMAVVLGSKLTLDYLLLLALVVVALLVVGVRSTLGFSKAKMQAAVLFSGFALTLLGAILVLGAEWQSKNSVLATRNFYGGLTVTEINADEPEWAGYRLNHGRISHGFQFREAGKSLLPSSYYGPQSGLGQAIRVLRPASSLAERRFGVIGLGVGTIAAYAKPGDYLHFYEINPDVIRIAEDERLFTYLKSCRGKVTITAGDARLSMERELKQLAPQRFDLLVVDAFSGDAPPLHLLTKQAFEIYMAHLAPTGIVAVNITNTFVDLRPVVTGISEAMHLNSVILHDDGHSPETVYSDWMLLSQAALPVGNSIAANIREVKRVVWTDDYSNLFQVLR